MKLFQQLLVAPAALGLMAPMVASAAELTPSVSDYSDTIEEVQSVSDFSDVYPTDWAYQALVDLAERHGCVAASPSGAMTRYEAAALLNTCIGDVAQVNEVERRLLSEFGPELAVIKGRVDGLEARMGEFEAGQFSTTTKLGGKTHFLVGAVDRDGDGSDPDSAVTFSYSQQLDLKTSFNGKDLLYTRVKAGNTPDDTWGSSTYGSYLGAAKNNSSVYTLDKLWYQFPVGDNYKVWVGPRIENYYMLASAPSIYRPILKGFALGGNGATYGASTGAGVGAAWTQSVDDPSQPRFAVSVNHVSSDGHSSNPNSGGIFTQSNKQINLVKFEYGSPRWQASLGYAMKDSGKDGGGYYSTTKGKSRTGKHTAVGARGYWKPEAVGIIPEISVGYDVANVDDNPTSDSDATERTAQWFVGMGWKDAFIDGNTAGIAFGQRQYATDLADGSSDAADDNFIWEAYYTFKVSDNITVTPAVFAATDSATGSNDDWVGGLVQTTFKF